MHGVTYPLLMAVIHVDKGKVIGITWDSSCRWCDEGQCSESVYDFDGSGIAGGGNCFVEDTSCITDKGTTRLCELNVNIVWTGTDSEDRYFLSATPRFSRLTTEQLSDYTNYLDSEDMKVDFKPSGQPTSFPTSPTGIPSAKPTTPTGQPTAHPTKHPENLPPVFPSGEPSSDPTGQAD